MTGGSDVADANSSNEHLAGAGADTDPPSPLRWPDYVEVSVLIASCLLGVLANLAVLRVSIRLRAYSKQISLLFCAILCADLLVCCARIPTSVFLIIADPPSAAAAAAAAAGVSVAGGGVTSRDHDNQQLVDSTTKGHDGSTTNAALTSTLGSGLVAAEPSSERRPKVTEDGGVRGEGGGGEEAPPPTRGEKSEGKIDIACEVWSLSGALLLTLTWLHLVVGVQRLAIIFAFSKYRKVFTLTLTAATTLGMGLLGLTVYTPLRVMGGPVERAGRGACRPAHDSPEGVLAARSATTAVLCLVPLLAAFGCYLVIMKSVWRAREVRTEAASQYTRVVVVTFFRLLSLVLTFFPVMLLTLAGGQRDVTPVSARRYVGHLLWLQSVLSPFITLQDNDFREKTLVPKQMTVAARRVSRAIEGGGEEGAVCGGPAGVLPDIGSSGGPDGEEHRARNLAEMRKENRRSQLKRGLSFITSADMRTIRGSTE